MQRRIVYLLLGASLLVAASSANGDEAASGDADPTTVFVILGHQEVAAVAPVIVEWTVARWKSDRPRVIADARTNQLLLVGAPDRTAEVKAVVANLDMEVIACGGSASATITLTHRTAAEVAPLVTRSLQWLRQYVDSWSGFPTPSPTPLVQPAPHPHHILVVGSERDIEAAREVIQRLDVPRGDEGDATKVWVVEHVWAERIAGILRRQFEPDGLRIDWDEETNQVVGTGTTGLLERATRLVRHFDVEATMPRWTASAYELAHRTTGEVLPLAKGVADYLAALRAMDPHAPPHPPIVTHADTQRNRLIFFGIRDDYRAIAAALDEMDFPAPDDKDD